MGGGGGGGGGERESERERISLYTRKFFTLKMSYGHCKRRKFNTLILYMYIVFGIVCRKKCFNTKNLTNKNF